jgi:cytoplasmic tRNA 2-thiolation protein 2
VTKVEQRSGDDQSSCQQEGCCGGSKEEGGCGTGGGGGCSSDTGPVADLNAYLCYSCQVNLKDYKNDAVEMLPPFVVQKVYDQEREQRLREQIQEFLIDDDDDE